MKKYIFIMSVILLFIIFKKEDVNYSNNIKQENVQKHQLQKKDNVSINKNHKQRQDVKQDSEMLQYVYDIEMDEYGKNKLNFNIDEATIEVIDNKIVLFEFRYMREKYQMDLKLNKTAGSDGEYNIDINQNERMDIIINNYQDDEIPSSSIYVSFILNDLSQSNDLDKNTVVRLSLIGDDSDSTDENINTNESLDTYNQEKEEQMQKIYADNGLNYDEDAMKLTELKKIRSALGMW